MKIINKIKQFFFKRKEKKQSNKNGTIDLSQFNLGDIVELEYVDPRTIGIVSKNTLTFTRLNHDEIDNRIIHGTIERIIWNKDLQTNLAYIKTFKNIDGINTVRQYLFLEYEIKNIRKLQ